MPFQEIPISSLIVNPSNDRHGDIQTEENAVYWLFSEHGDKMMGLAKDLVAQREVFDAPLVIPNEGDFIVYDGNRRITCVKILAGIIEPPLNYSKKFDALIEEKVFSKDMSLSCQVEESVSKANEIINRRHNGTDDGKGQLKWNVRAKGNHAKRVGSANQYPIAEAIEDFLAANGYPRARNIKRSTLSRLVTAKKRQALLGIELDETGKLRIREDTPQVLETLSRIADDIVEQRLSLKHLLDSEGVEAYLSELETAGLLFTAPKSTSKGAGASNTDQNKQKKRPVQSTLIPKTYQPIEWKANQGKIKVIWLELQYSLLLSRNEASIPIVFRTLFELCVDCAIKRVGSPKKENLAARARHLADHFHREILFTRKELDDFYRVINNSNSPRELEALHRVVHSCTA